MKACHISLKPEDMHQLQVSTHVVMSFPLYKVASFDIFTGLHATRKQIAYCKTPGCLEDQTEGWKLGTLANWFGD